MSSRATQQKYASKNLCEQCGRRSAASATLCRACLGEYNARTAALKAKLLAAGRCAWCANLNASGFRACDDCLARFNARRSRQRASEKKPARAV